MGYTIVPTVYTNDTWTASNHNLYIKDNLAHVEAQGEGKETFFVPVGGYWPQPGSLPGFSVITDNGVLSTLGVPFDKDTDQLLNFLNGMPKRYNGGVLEVSFWWMATDMSSGSVVWQIAINGLDDGDALGADPVAGLANIADAWLGNNILHKTAFVEVTPNGSPSDDNIGFELQAGRNADHGSDNGDANATLLGMLFVWTTNVEMDD